MCGIEIKVYTIDNRIITIATFGLVKALGKYDHGGI